MADMILPHLNGSEYPGCIAARVTAVHRDRFEICTEHGESGAQMKRGLQGCGELPTVGDYIAVEYNPAGDSVAVGVLPRRTLFARMDSWSGGRQLVAANVDVVFIATSLNGEFNIRRLERYLALAKESGARPVFLLTKRDLADEPALAARLEEARRLAPEVQALAVSAYTGEGMRELESILLPGMTAVLLGSSGVGKSSLVNALCGESCMETAEIGRYDKGRHTTVHRQMIALRTGAYLIDTPGMRELGMWDAVDGVEEVFEEIAEAAGRCRYRDCSHTHEPGCAVLQGLRDGLLDPGRVRNYLQLHGEADATARRAMKQRREKEISKASKSFKKMKGR